MAFHLPAGDGKEGGDAWDKEEDGMWEVQVKHSEKGASVVDVNSWSGFTQLEKKSIYRLQYGIYEHLEKQSFSRIDVAESTESDSSDASEMLLVMSKNAGLQDTAVYVEPASISMISASIDDDWVTNIESSARDFIEASSGGTDLALTEQLGVSPCFSYRVAEEDDHMEHTLEADVDGSSINRMNPGKSTSEGGAAQSADGLNGPGVVISAGVIDDTPSTLTRNNAENKKNIPPATIQLTDEELKYIDEKTGKRSAFVGNKEKHEMSDYEKIQKHNIVERMIKMREVFSDVRKLKAEILDDVEKEKKRKAKHEMKPTKSSKKRKVDNIGIRRSAREKKPVDYCNDDLDWEIGNKKKAPKRRNTDHSNKYLKARKLLPPGHNQLEGQSKVDLSAVNSVSDEMMASSNETRRSTRPRKEAIYKSDLPREDEFVFCQICKELKYHGCEMHPLIFDYDARLEIAPSKAGKNAGRGVFNIDRRRSIPVNVMFGPYEGDFYTVADYNKLKKENGESGYAWEIKSQENLVDVVGYFDPGPNPNPKEAWMPMVNMAPKDRHQNVVAVQFFGKIYYMTVSVITYGQEILVNYGDSYGKELNITKKEKSVYELVENWENEGVECIHCGRGFVNETVLQNHIDTTGKPGLVGCVVLAREKHDEEVLNGIRPHVCEDCGKGFKVASKLKEHRQIYHSNEKPYSCTDCDKAYATKSMLNVHIREKHSGMIFACSWCEEEFSSKSNLNKHWKTVCDREKPEFKCPECGIEFVLYDRLSRHIKAVHRREFGHKCKECGERFSTKMNMVTHVRNVHEDVQPSYKCDKCGFTARTSVRLDHHKIKKHTLQWYWNCDICDKRDIEAGFLLPSDLRKHMMSLHPDEYVEQLKLEKPAVCIICQKRFKSEKEVSTHIKKMHNV